MDWGSQVFGVDVSHHQGAVNWSQLAKGQGGKWRFAWVKATEGATYKDPRRLVNLAGAHHAGLATGAYHYARPHSNSPEAEARNLLDVLGELNLDLALPAVLDLEHPSPHPSQAGMSAAVLRAWVVEWLGIVAAATGKAPVLYTGYWYCQKNLGSKAPGWSPLPALLWQPRYPVPAGTTPPHLLTKRPLEIPGMPWAVWQYATPTGVPGIKAGKKCDVNVTDQATLDQMTDGSDTMGLLIVAGAAAAVAAGTGALL
jgi:GH25 family lysozyme M1 (1,4-beta-N-acetylmuramidase)